MTYPLRGEVAPQLEAACRAAGLALQVVDGPVELAGALDGNQVSVAVLHGLPSPRDNDAALEAVHGVAPTLSVVRITPASKGTGGLTAEEGVLATLPWEVGAEELARWLATGARLSSAQGRAARLEHAVEVLAGLTAEWGKATGLPDLAEQMLGAGSELVGRAWGAAPRAGLLALMGEDGDLGVRAAAGMHAPHVGGPVPVELRARMVRAAEAGEAVIEGGELLVPLRSGERLLGVLLLAAGGRAGEVPPVLRVFADRAALTLENALLFELAAVDTTTRCYTRGFALKRLYETLKSAYRERADVTLLLMDLDSFKAVNDTYGHLAGDRVLHDVGAALRNAVRDTDIPGRYGGDEFLVVLPNTPTAGAVSVARRIQQGVAGIGLRAGAGPLGLGISVGVAGIRTTNSEGPGNRARPVPNAFAQAVETLLAEADTLLYRAKSAATHNVVVGKPLGWGALIDYDYEDAGPAF